MRRDKYQRNVLEFYVEIKTAATYREGFTETYREELGVHLTEFDGDFFLGRSPRPRSPRRPRQCFPVRAPSETGYHPPWPYPS